MALTSLEQDPDSGSDTGTELQDPEVASAPFEEKEAPSPPPALPSSSASLEKAVAGPAPPVLPDDFWAHQELLKKDCVQPGLGG